MEGIRTRSGKPARRTPGMHALVVPARVPVTRYTLGVALEVPISEDPYEVKVRLRDMARRVTPHIYFASVNVEGLEGRDVEVNNLGRWLFGIPGYKGHYTQRIMGREGKSWRVLVALPETGNGEVDSMLVEMIEASARTLGYNPRVTRLEGGLLKLDLGRVRDKLRQTGG